jgi:EAL domain-containing protein (putative c-di-GMP-specific phosphodiesterase class I)
MIMSNIAKLKNYGFRLAVDDFGAGYASFSYLTRLPIDAVKIDKQFMDRFGSDPNAKTITQAIINLGNKLGLTVIAEGVEDNDQESFLLKQHCTTAQGYLYGRPVAIDEIDVTLTADTPELQSTRGT